MIEYYKNLSLENLFYIDENGTVQEEQWKDIPNWEKLYKASDLGRIKSLSRKVFGGKAFYFTNDKIMKQNICTTGYLHLTLQSKGLVLKKKTHQLVAMAFLNHIPCGYSIVIDHKNNIPLDNRLCNLQQITQLENLKKDKKGITGFNNVYFEKGRFRARVRFEEKQYCLGYFNDAETAKKTVDFVYEKLLKNENIDEYIKSNKNKYYKNISMDNGKYRPRFVVNKKRINLPAFEKLEDAINCLNEAKKSYSN